MFRGRNNIYSRFIYTDFFSHSIFTHHSSSISVYQYRIKKREKKHTTYGSDASQFAHPKIIELNSLSMGIVYACEYTLSSIKQEFKVFSYCYCDNNSIRKFLFYQVFGFKTDAIETKMTAY